MTFKLDERSATEITDALLANLGPDRRAVARRLRELGVKGVVGSVQSCPVANYLKQGFKEPPQRVLVMANCRLLIAEWHAGRILIERTLPVPVVDFVSRFDDRLIGRDLAQTKGTKL